MQYLPNQSEYVGQQARAYDEVREREEKWKREQSALEELLDEALSESRTVLDVPVGTGRFLPAYEVRQLKSFGIDVSNDMLTQARTRARSAGLAPAPIAFGDARSLPLASSSMDASVCVRLVNLVDFPTFETILGELARVTRHDVVLGIRVHRLWGGMRLAARRVLRPRVDPLRKVITHPERKVRRALLAHGLRVSDKRLIATGRYRANRYYFFLLSQLD